MAANVRSLVVGVFADRYEAALHPCGYCWRNQLQKTEQQKGKTKRENLR